MRKIEIQMVQAINQNRNWQSGNTMVTYLPEEQTSRVYLHGHLIAKVDHCGFARPVLSTLLAWPTRTTMSRLRALDIDVCQRKGYIYLNGDRLV